MFQSDAFAARLKEIRLGLYLSQEALAHRLGVSRVALSYYENGQRTPDVAFLQALHEVTGYSLEYLMGTSEAKSAENVILTAETGLTEDAIAWVRENADHLNVVIDIAPQELSLIIMFAAVFANGYPYITHNFDAATFFEAGWNNAESDLLDLCKFSGYSSLTPEEREACRQAVRKWEESAETPRKAPDRKMWPEDLETQRRTAASASVMKDLKRLDGIYLAETAGDK